jgi:hypothetical protein
MPLSGIVLPNMSTVPDPSAWPSALRRAMNSEAG